MLKDGGLPPLVLEKIGTPLEKDQCVSVTGSYEGKKEHEIDGLVANVVVKKKLSLKVKSLIYHLIYVSTYGDQYIAE